VPTGWEGGKEYHVCDLLLKKKKPHGDGREGGGTISPGSVWERGRNEKRGRDSTVALKGKKPEHIRAGDNGKTATLVEGKIDTSEGGWKVRGKLQWQGKNLDSSCSGEDVFLD